MLPRFLLVLSLLFACLSNAVSASEVLSEPGQGETLTLKTAGGTEFSAYRVGPPGARIGILLMPESWGVDAHMREWADWLGEQGHRVIVPDLYQGKIATNREDAEALAAGLRQADANEKYRAALDVLKAPGRKQVAMGWGFGGTQALQAALMAPKEVHAVVNYEGNLVAGRFADFSGAVLAMYPKTGASVSAEQLHDFSETMKRLKRPLVLSYFDAQKIESSDGHYSDQAAQLVWKDTQAFLQHYVKPDVTPERKVRKKRKRRRR